jgi:hypothetical protein
MQTSLSVSIITLGNQFPSETARESEDQLEVTPRALQFPNAELESKETPLGHFLGVSTACARNWAFWAEAFSRLT